MLYQKQSIWQKINEKRIGRLTKIRWKFCEYKKNAVVSFNHETDEIYEVYDYSFIRLTIDITVSFIVFLVLFLIFFKFNLFEQAGFNKLPPSMVAQLMLISAFWLIFLSMLAQYGACCFFRYLAKQPLCEQKAKSNRLILRYLLPIALIGSIISFIIPILNK